MPCFCQRLQLMESFSFAKEDAVIKGEEHENKGEEHEN
jgi:hypothetical protein